MPSVPSNGSYFRCVEKNFTTSGHDSCAALRLAPPAPAWAAHEPVARAFVGVDLVALAQLLHRRFGRRNGRADARIVAGVEAEDRRLDVRQLRLEAAVTGARRVTVVDDRRVQGWLCRRVAKAARAAPAETDDAGLAIRCRQLLAVLHRRIEPRLDIGRRQRLNRLPDAAAERFGTAAVRPLPERKSGTIAMKPSCASWSPTARVMSAMPADVVDHEHDAGLGRTLRIDHPGFQHRPVGHLDVGPFAVPR